MASFKDFAGGGDEGFSQEPTSIRYRQSRDNKVGSRIEKVWATDFERCTRREDYEKYVSKYGKYDSNKYVEQARAKIESFDRTERARAERARIEREKAARKDQQILLPSGRDGRKQKEILNTLLKIAVCLAIIGGVGFLSYAIYEHEAKKKPSKIISLPKVPQQSQEEDPEGYVLILYEPTTGQASNTGHQQTQAKEQDVWYDCSICGSTGVCQLCFGSGRCGGCGGGGQIFSVFYGDEVGSGRMTDCSSCGGSGSCPQCGGSTLCFACHGAGKCKLQN